MTTANIFNSFEIALWSTIGVALLITSRKAPIKLKKLARLSACAFLAFAISDYIEIQTGAWWKPWWLLCLKAACIGVFLVTFYKYTRMRRVEDSDDL